jgi:hypothetical protein
MTRQRRPISEDDLTRLRNGLELLKAARDHFQAAQAFRAYRATLRAIKSADGAIRHAIRLAQGAAWTDPP